MFYPASPKRFSARAGTAAVLRYSVARPDLDTAFYSTTRHSTHDQHFWTVPSEGRVISCIIPNTAVFSQYWPFCEYLGNLFPAAAETLSASYFHQRKIDTMAPPIPTPAVKVSTKQEALVEKKQARSTTPSAIIPGKDEAKTITDDKEVSLQVEAAGVHADKLSQLATVFKSDLTNIRNLVTCSICDQLLYEPWTLGCGHTYCYSVGPPLAGCYDYTDLIIVLVQLVHTE